MSVDGSTTSLTFFFFQRSGGHRALHSFPTRRSSDLCSTRYCGSRQPPHGTTNVTAISEDRKSTRLNSSHVKISYAVFCLKKKSYLGRAHDYLPIAFSDSS